MRALPQIGRRRNQQGFVLRLTFDLDLTTIRRPKLSVSAARSSAATTSSMCTRSTSCRPEDISTLRLSRSAAISDSTSLPRPSSGP